MSENYSIYIRKSRLVLFKLHFSGRKERKRETHLEQMERFFKVFEIYRGNTQAVSDANNVFLGASALVLALLWRM